MKPLDLIESAEILLRSGRGKPSQVNLRRATSSAYYAVFHCLARNGADCLVGGANADRSQPAWRQVYRALDHGLAKTACVERAIVALFPQDIEDFANMFVAMQKKRHAADYDPFARFTKSEVATDIRDARLAITRFQAASIKDRRAFAAHILFKKRP